MESIDAMRARVGAYEAARERLYPGVCSFGPEMIEAVLKEAGIDRAPTNEERSAIEVQDFIIKAPERYTAYVLEGTRDYPSQSRPWKQIGTGELTTWTGDHLGVITFGRPYRDNMGSERIPVRVDAINGRKYHGTYYRSSGDYCRLRAVKGA